MAEQQRYDLFLSHNRAEAEAVELIARRLRDEAGLTPFLDTWHLVPGEPWQEGLEQAIEESASCAVFLGPAGLGTWDNESMRAALEQRADTPTFRVIPVLLPGATLPERGKLPPFLARLTWVDFRGGLDDAQAFHALVSGVKGVAPGTAETDGEQVCPFRGLQVFEEEHAPFFFGREALTQHLLESLRADRFLAVIGPSGSGKSSLVRAGLVPHIRRGALAGSAEWPVVLLRPGPHPLDTLATRLLPLLGPTADPLAARSTLAATLEAGERGLHTSVQTILAAAPESRRLLLVVDQLEEVFTLCHDETERRRFIEALLYAATIAGGQTVAVVTMRADFLGRAASEPGLAARLKGLELVGPMDADELRRAMTGPAEKVGLHFEKGLVETILDDLGEEPGSLPLLQHTLLELWQRRRGDWLTTDAYQQIGGVRGALASRADAIYAALTPPQQEAARRVLLRLTQPGEGTEDTRRRASLAELLPAGIGAADVEAAIHDLAEGRLLTITAEEGRTSDDDGRKTKGQRPGTDDGRKTDDRPKTTDERPTSDDGRKTKDQGPTTDDRRPTTDQGPTTNDRRPTKDQRPTTDDRPLTTESAEPFATAQRDVSSVVVDVSHEALIRGWPRLQQWISADREALRTHRQLTEAAESWDESRRDGSYLYSGARLATAREWEAKYGDELNTLERAFLDASNAAREAESQERRSRAQRTIAGLAGALVVVSLALVAALLFWRQADYNTRLARAQYLATEGQLRATDDPLLGLRLALEGLATLPAQEDQLRTRAASDVVFPLARTARVAQLAHDVEEWFVSPDRRLALVVGADEQAKLVSIADGSLTPWASAVVQPEDDREDDRIEGVAFIPNSDAFIVRYAEQPGILTHANPATPSQQLAGAIEGVNVAPGGALFVVRYEEQPAELRRASDASIIALLGDTLDQLTFSRDGASFVADYDDANGRLVRAADGTTIRELAGELRGDRVRFSPDGATLGLVYEGGQAELRRATDGEPLRQLNGRVSRLTFSPGGTLLLAEYEDRTAELFGATGDTPLVRLDGNVDKVLLSPDEDLYVVDYNDGPGELRRISDPALAQKLRSRVGNVTFDAAGASFVVDYDNTPGQLFVAGRQTPLPLRADVERVLSGPDGLFVVRYQNSSADLIDLRFPERPVALGSGTRDFAFLPGGALVAALYRDGGAYLLDVAVLRSLAAETILDTPESLLAALCAGPLAGPLWRAEQERTWREYLGGQAAQSCTGLP